MIKGRFQQKQIENVLRRYIGMSFDILPTMPKLINYLVEYVTCKTCRSPDTDLSKGDNRLWYVTCGSCGKQPNPHQMLSGVLITYQRLDPVSGSSEDGILRPSWQEKEAAGLRSTSSLLFLFT